jgi:small subunit ribosomal protein S15
LRQWGLVSWGPCHDWPGIPPGLNGDAGEARVFSPVERAARDLQGSSTVLQLNYIKMPTVVKPEIIAEYKTHEKDTGSSEVQIALLTARINHLTEHLRTHRKDFHSRRGLLQMASRRRKLLDYLKQHNLPKYNELLQKLNLRK